MPFPAHEYMKYKIAKVKGGGSCLSCVAVTFAHLSSSLSHTHLRLVRYLLPNFICGPEDLGRDPFNYNSDKSDQEKYST